MNVETGKNSLDSVKEVIELLSPEDRARVHCIAGLFRAMLNESDNSEVELAMTLVLAELSRYAAAAHTHPAEKMALFANCPGCEAEKLGYR
jgi:hypothetical protein